MNSGLYHSKTVQTIKSPVSALESTTHNHMQTNSVYSAKLPNTYLRICAWIALIPVQRCTIHVYACTITLSFAHFCAYMDMFLFLFSFFCFCLLLCFEITPYCV